MKHVKHVIQFDHVAYKINYVCFWQAFSYKSLITSRANSAKPKKDKIEKLYLVISLFICDCESRKPYIVPTFLPTYLPTCLPRRNYSIFVKNELGRYEHSERQWLWLSWHSGRFQGQRSAVRIH